MLIQRAHADNNVCGLNNFNVTSVSHSIATTMLLTELNSSGRIGTLVYGMYKNSGPCAREKRSSFERDNWARNVSPNKNAKVYIGAPASSSAAGSGYLDASSLSAIAKQMRDSFPSFGGVMLWDASQAYGKPLEKRKSIVTDVHKKANDRYDVAIKNALTAAGGTGFTFPACSAPAFASGSGYSGGAQVSYNGCACTVQIFRGASY